MYYYKPRGLAIRTWPGGWDQDALAFFLLSLLLRQYTHCPKFYVSVVTHVRVRVCACVCVHVRVRLHACVHVRVCLSHNQQQHIPPPCWLYKWCTRLVHASMGSVLCQYMLVRTVYQASTC